MRVNVAAKIPMEVDLKPGDMIVTFKRNREGKKLTIHRIIESGNGVNIVFTNGTWRPLSTYGITWQKYI